MSKCLFVNPVLSDKDFGFARIGGPGLANCMFFVARAVIIAKKLDVPLLRPTWERFGIGQWMRKERDKRFYMGLFRPAPRFSSLKKLWLLKTMRHVKEEDVALATTGIIMVDGLKGYFSDIWEDASIVREYFANNILPKAIMQVPGELGNVVAVHVRLGDYPEQYRIPIGWYVTAIKSMREAFPSAGKVEFWVFSDGADYELAPLLALPNVKRMYFGNALADMVAMSRAKLIIGSDSTFSGWAAFLGGVPCAFAKLHYGRPLKDKMKVFVSTDAAAIGKWYQDGRTND